MTVLPCRDAAGRATVCTRTFIPERCRVVERFLGLAGSGRAEAADPYGSTASLAEDGPVARSRRSGPAAGDLRGREHAGLRLPADGVAVDRQVEVDRQLHGLGDGLLEGHALTVDGDVVQGHGLAVRAGDAGHAGGRLLERQHGALL